MDREWTAWVNETLTETEPDPEARARLTGRLRAAGELEFLYSAWVGGGKGEQNKRVLRRLAVEHL